MKSRVDLLLASTQQPIPKTKASFSLDQQAYDAWRTLCETRHLNQGELLSAMMVDVVAKSGKADNSNSGKKRGRPKRVDA